MLGYGLDRFFLKFRSAVAEFIAPLLSFRMKVWVGLLAY